MDTKKCKMCGINKTLDKFHKCKHCSKGVRSVCKECRKIEQKEYSSRDYVLDKNKNFYQEHKDEIRERTSKHYWTLNGQYHQYKKRAKKSNIEFDLTENDCVAFYKTKCYYCGGNIKALGIDRVDNNKGYILENIVPCCSTCNFMKHMLNEITFIDHLKKIVKHLKL